MIAIWPIGSCLALLLLLLLSGWENPARADIKAPTNDTPAVEASGLALNTLPGFAQLGNPPYGWPFAASNGRDSLVVNSLQTGRWDGLRYDTEFPWSVIATLYRGDSNSEPRTLEISDLKSFMGGPAGAGARVACNGANFLVVWWDGRTIDQVYFPGPVYGAIVTLDPFASSERFVICDHPAGQMEPQVASDGADYYVTWLDHRDRPTPNPQGEVTASVYGTKVSAQGVVDHRNGLALDRTANPIYNLAVASNRRNYLVVWQNGRGGDRFIWGSLVGQDGISLGSSFVVSTGGASQANPLVTSDGTNYFVAWSEALAGVWGEGGEFHGTSVSSAGVVANSRGFPIVQALRGDSYLFSLACLAGKPVVLWREFQNQAASRKLYAKLGEMNGAFSRPPQLVRDMADHYPAFVAGTDRLLVLDRGSSTEITLSAPNDVPTLFLNPSSGTLAYLVGSGAVRLDAGLLLEASETVSFSQAELAATLAGTGVLSLLPGPETESIALEGNQVIYKNLPVAVFNIDEGDRIRGLRIVFNANATHAAVQAVARSIAYRGDSPNPEPVELRLADALGHASPISKITVAPLPQILSHSSSTNLDLGSTFIIEAEVIGYPFVWSQWRLNGIPLRDYTNYYGRLPWVDNRERLRIVDSRLEYFGAYIFSAQNAAGIVKTEPIFVLPNVPPLQGGDAFAQRLPLSGFQGVGSGSNQSATKEAGEPSHAGKVGGRSVWFAWQADASGIATIRTTGSAFDTILAVYTGTDVANLVEMASDDDSGGFLTSKVQFNAVAGTIYHLAIDGFNAAGGSYVLSWELEVTSELLPVILTQPASQAVPINTAAQFFVSASGSGLTYQWSFNDIPLVGATGASYTQPNVQYADIGKYTVRTRNDQGREVISKPAFLETGPSREALSQDKLEDLLARILARQGQARSGNGSLQALAAGGTAFISVAAGVPDSKLLSNRDSTTQLGEPSICDAIGGASQWLAIRPETSGTLEIDTIGSNIDTLLAVYNGTSILNLQEIACDNNGAPDGQRSRLQLPAAANRLYLVAVDGVNGARGTININWKLQTPNSVKLAILLRNGPKGLEFEVTGSTTASVVLESSSNLRQWIPIQTNLPAAGSLKFLEGMTNAQKFFRLIPGQ